MIHREVLAVFFFFLLQQENFSVRYSVATEIHKCASKIRLFLVKTDSKGQFVRAVRLQTVSTLLLISLKDKYTSHYTNYSLIGIIMIRMTFNYVFFLFVFYVIWGLHVAE